MASPFSWESILEQAVGQLVAYAVGGAITPVLAPLTQTATNEAWSTLPVLPLDPQIAAQVAVKTPSLMQSMAAQAAQSGVSPDNFARIIDAVNVPPGLAELFALFNRGQITADQLTQGFRSAQIEDEWLDALPSLARQWFSPADAAQARQQGFLTAEQQYAYAAAQGITQEDAEHMFEISGLPPGVGEGLQLLRRGLIDETRFSEYVFQGNTKRQYLPDLLQLVDVPLSPSVAVEAALRERIPQEQAQQIAALSGMSAESFGIALETTGRAMGIGEGLTLVNRKVITEDDFRQIVARSDVRTEYTDWLLNLRVKYPPLFQVTRAVTAGAVTDDVARKTLEDEGYTAEWIDGLIKSAHSTKTTATKHVAAGTIEALYNAGLDTHAQAVAQLETLGYTGQDAEEYLQAWTARRIASELVHGITQTRTKYTGWKIDATSASSELATFNLDPATIERLMNWWGNEREANRPTVTVAQITNGFKYGRYTYDQATQLLQQRGYTPDDALTVLWDSHHGDPRVTTPPPPGT